MTNTENSSSPLHILIVVRQRFIQDALVHILQNYPGPLRLTIAGSGEQAQAALRGPVEAILADPILLLQIEEVCQKELRYYRSAVPLIALLPVDTRDYRDAALRLGANGLVALDAAPQDLIPLLQSLLGQARLVNGMAGRFQENAQHLSPVGEAGYAPDLARERLEKVSDRAMEQLARAANPAVQDDAQTASELEGEGQVFLRGLLLSASAADTDPSERRVRTACNLNCGAHFCGLDASLRGGKLISLEPAAFPDPRYQRICQKGISFVQLNSHPDRLLYPLKRSGPRGAGGWERIRWDQALDEIAQRMQSLMSQHGPESLMFFPYTGTLSALNGYAGVYMRLAALLGASANSSREFGIDSAAPSGIEETFGEGTGYLANDYTDLPNSRLVLIWGANPVQSRMNWWRFFLEARKAGARLVTIDPRFSATAAKSDEWIQVRPGTDLYLALGMLRWIIQSGAVDEDFVLKHTVAPFLVCDETTDSYRAQSDQLSGALLRGNSHNGGSPYRVWDDALQRPVPPEQAQRPALRGRFILQGQVYHTAYELLVEMVEPYTPELVAEKTGLAVETVVNLASLYASVRPARIFTLYGVDRWQHGAVFGRLIATLAALTGNIGQPGAGAGVDGVCDSMLPLTSFTYPGGRRPREINPARLPDYILHGQPYQVRGVFAGFNNWLNQWPDRNLLLGQVLPRLDLFVVADQYMTDTARWADYVLPAATLFEREDLVKGPGPYLQYQPKILSPRGEARPDFDIAAGLAERLGSAAAGGFTETPRAYLSAMLPELVPGLTPAQEAVFFEQGVIEIAGRVRPGVAHQDLVFKTPTGRIEFYKESLLPHGQALPGYVPPVEAEPGCEDARRFPLVCITEHNFYRVHSSFNHAPWLRELDHEPWVSLHPEEARSRNIEQGCPVRVFNDRGYVVLRAKVSRSVPKGMAVFSQGWQSQDFISGHAQSLTHWKVTGYYSYGPNISFSDVLVEVAPARREV